MSNAVAPTEIDEDGLWPPQPMATTSQLPMSAPEYQRYGRQMVLPSFGGLSSQLALRSSRVLVIGGGGLGCPAVQSLASCGVGSITVVDHDVVERSNLARQMLHTEERIGMNKAKSIQVAVRQLNPHVRVEAVTEALTTSNAVQLVDAHDIVLDCTDNPLTRYLINDAAVLTGKTVVSGAAQGTEGQLVVLNKSLSISGQRGPCYRCLFPHAPRPQDVTDCEDGGVLGTITALVGTLQANETIKLLTGMGSSTDEQQQQQQQQQAVESGSPSRSTMLLISLLEPLQPFRTIKMRGRRSDCRICGDDAVVHERGLRKIVDLESEDYVAFCGLAPKHATSDSAEDSIEDRLQAMTVDALSNQGTPPSIIVDVRTESEYSIVKLPRTLNLPWTDIRRDANAALLKCLDALPPKQSQEQQQQQQQGERDAPIEVPVLCRRGNDSVLAARKLNAAWSNRKRGTQGSDRSPGSQDPQTSAGTADSSRLFDDREIRFVDVTGGMRAWTRSVDASVPEY